MYKITYQYANREFVKFCFTMDEVDTWVINHLECNVLKVEEDDTQLKELIW